MKDLREYKAFFPGLIPGKVRFFFSYFIKNYDTDGRGTEIGTCKLERPF